MVTKVVTLPKMAFLSIAHVSFRHFNISMKNVWVSLSLRRSSTVSLEINPLFKLPGANCRSVYRVYKAFHRYLTVSFDAVSEKTHFLSPVVEDMFRLYDGVDTFVLFIGYPRSSHSLVGAILDAHPEIIIPHEYDLLQKWERFRSAKARENNLQKYFLYYELHKLSTKQATFGIRAKNPLFMGGSYNYHVPGLWQGGYHNKIKV